MATTFLNDITDDFKELYESKEDYDAIIIAGEEPYIKEFQVHSLILRARSSYFRSAFSANWAERNNDGHLVLKKPNVRALVIEIILKYLYCGMLEFQNQENEIILEVLIAADEFGLQKLINSIEEFLTKICYKLLQSDPIKVIDFIICHNAFDNLKKVYLETFDKNFKVFLQQDPIKTLEKTLHELVQLVRFHQINGEEFMLEVWPYRHLLPDSLIEDIFRCYLVSNAVPKCQSFTVRWGNFKPDTVLINKEIASLLTKWVDRKAVDVIDVKNLKGIRYNFNLIFRSSIDGFSSQTFHQKCNDKGATIVIAKILGSNQLVGGYNPLDWNGNCLYKTTADSFLFSLDLNNLYSAKLGRVTSSSCAVCCKNNYGPTFGDGYDLHAPNNSNNWQCKVSSYPNIEIPKSFTISDYEVFQL
ncbi:3331_t:CDS:2, partial [Dentiscutata heterogama]